MEHLRKETRIGPLTSLEGLVTYRTQFPRDKLGNFILYQGITFIHTRPRLEALNRYMAATFLTGEYDEKCFVLEVDATTLREAIKDFKLHDLPDFERAERWFKTQDYEGEVKTCHMTVE